MRNGHILFLRLKDRIRRTELPRWKFFLLIIGLTLIVLGIYSTITSGAETKTEYKTFKLNPTDIAVSCKNGNNPNVKILDPTLVIVSCAK